MLHVIPVISEHWPGEYLILRNVHILDGKMTLELLDPDAIHPVNISFGTIVPIEVVCEGSTPDTFYHDLLRLKEVRKVVPSSGETLIFLNDMPGSDLVVKLNVQVLRNVTISTDGKIFSGSSIAEAVKDWQDHFIPRN